MTSRFLSERSIVRIYPGALGIRRDRSENPSSNPAPNSARSRFPATAALHRSLQQSRRPIYAHVVDRAVSERRCLRSAFLATLSLLVAFAPAWLSWSAGQAAQAVSLALMGLAVLAQRAS